MKALGANRFALACILTLLVGGARGGETLDVVLRGAVFADEPGVDDPSLVLDISRDGERWETVWGVAGDYSKTAHWGYVLEGRVSEEAVGLVIRMPLHKDSWSAGGRGTYRIHMERGPDGSYAGRYEGTFNGMAVKGAAEASWRPNGWQAGADFVPVRPGEHPRILFRKGELEGLRKRAKTALGRAALAKMGTVRKDGKDGDIVGMGVKYQLTGDKAFAEETRPFIENLIALGHLSDQYGNNVGERMERIAVTYDLCYDAWDRAFKRKIEDYLVWAAETMSFRQKSMNRGINWHAASNWSAPLYNGMGFAGLALWGEKGPAPRAPEKPTEAATVAPAAGYVPAEGVPVSRFVNEEMPSEWIYVGGFKPEDGEDVLASIGGVGAARPEAGTVVEFRGRREVFRPISREQDKGYWQTPNMMRGKEMIDVTNATERIMFSTAFFYTVVENDRARWVQLSTGNLGVKIHLAGKTFGEGDCVHLEKGLYPIMAEIATGWTEPWGRVLIQPRMIEVSREFVDAQLAEARAEYGATMDDWRYATGEWKRLDGADMDFVNVFERGRRMVMLHYREGVGTGGFQAEIGGYSAIATRACAPYAAAYRRMFGEDLSPFEDITHYVPRKMFGQVYGADGVAIAQDINGTPDIDAGVIATLYPVIPEQLKGAALWGWHFCAGVKGEASVADLVAEAPLETFLNYPVGAEGVHPSKGMPLTWRAPDFGYYGFRNAWAGKDDFLLQVFAKAHYIGGWNGPNGGTFRLMGLGHVWAHGQTDRNRHRWEESVVMLPDDDINVGACGRIDCVEMRADGSGVVTIDMNDIYAGRVVDENGRGKPLYEKYGGFRRASAFADSGITGLRSIAVHYAGGDVPCVIGIVDRISGGRRKVWTWQLGGGYTKGKGEPGDYDNTTVEGKTFTIRKADGATLRGTFVAPANVKVYKEVKPTTMIGGGGSSAGKTLERPIPGVFAEGDGEFFCVVTVQRGEPPAVQAEGRGLAASATTAGRMLKFDGHKVIITRGATLMDDAHRFSFIWGWIVL